MATPISYHLERTPSAGTPIASFIANSDGNAQTAAQQYSTMFQVTVTLIRTDNNANLNTFTPAAQASAIGNQVSGVAWSPY